MEVSGQFYASATLIPGKEKEAARASEPVQTLLTTEKLSLLPENQSRFPGYPLHSLTTASADIPRLIF